MAISLYELSQRISSSMPLGTIVPYYGTDEPSGWKICDGRSCAGSELAKKLEISNVPDLRGRFIRMIGGNAAGMAVAQSDELKPHTHSYQACSGDGNGVGWGGCARPTFQTGATGGVETRPINMAFNYIIKTGTNVILYYVSNIIYKAIAIGKSLLSRAKEEVRRTMAISLKNHEDRIVKLESYPIIKELFVTNVDDGLSRVTLNDSVWNYDLILISCGDFVTEDNNWALIPVTKSTIHKKLCFTQCVHDTNDGIKPTSSGVEIVSGYIYDNYVQLYNIFTTITTRGLANHVDVCNTGINTVIGMKFGLKQYYCFSNNILLYRLTQILFDSSLLGLFSQKGGARTI